MERCKKCIMPVNVVEMEPDGICVLCHKDNGQIQYKGENELKIIVDKHSNIARRAGAQYDCLVPISGGKDSMYALWYIVKILGKKPLAFNFAHGFIDPAAKRNIDNAIKILEVDIFYNDNNKMLRKYLKHNIKVLPNQPAKHMSKLGPVLCTGCSEGYSAFADVLAKEHKLSLIIQGGCPIEPDLRSFRKVSGKSTIEKVFKMSLQELSEVLACPIFYNIFYPRNINTHLLYTKALLRAAKNKIIKSKRSVKKIHLFSYLTWNSENIISTLEKEINWTKPEDRTSSTRFDCRLHILRDQLNLIYAGFSEKDVMYSLMIRKGMITREEALYKAEKEIEEEQALVDGVLRDFLKDVSLSDKFDIIRKSWEPRS